MEQHYKQQEEMVAGVLEPKILIAIVIKVIMELVELVVLVLEEL
ncbi:MAG TPA: hypothetical protein PKN22_03305 [Taishania sp.]|nr:hypothetical protein [Taishania sp.]